MEWGSKGVLGNLMPCEEMLEVGHQRKKLRIAIAKESAPDETRVAMAPHSVGFLVNCGHEVFVEAGAGERTHFADQKYVDQGAIIEPVKSNIYACDVVVKVLPPNEEELSLMKGRQVLFSSYDVNLQPRQYIEKLMELKITAIGFEFYKDSHDDVYPIIQSFSEISGTTSILIAAEYLSNAHGGKGEMLGGISGISPTDVVILGAGTAAEYAARTAMGLGASVKVFDKSINRLRELQHRLGTKIFTSVLQPLVLLKALRSADVVVGALYENGRVRDYIVSEDSIKQMKPNSVIVDLCMNQGGCFETSEVTSLANPTFNKYGVVHYCVPNIPAKVSRTATYVLSNILGQIIIELGDTGGINQMVKENAGLRAGVYVYNGILTNEVIGNRLGLPSQDINLLLAAF
ncbi:MAG: alanine dehydrogenase [Salinivirgaceae bacterium]|nr:alanine dehydrogenase [Salinivirgaceae bacterium]MBR5168200.1 alanine dehydrogenase [Salinivirgaceae bacterium]